jgi:hypothetical protein
MTEEVGFSDFTEAIPYIESTIGTKKEVWFAFDMDETLAYWDFYLPAHYKGYKEASASDFYNFIESGELKDKSGQRNQILRPSTIEFLAYFLNKGIAVNFAIYSNTTKQDRTVKIAEILKEQLGVNPNFRICFLYHNKFIGKANDAGAARLSVSGARSNVNLKVPTEPFRPDKTMESIREGYAAAGHPIPKKGGNDDYSALFFFDDVEYGSIESVIGSNYILMERYKGKVAEAAAAAPSGKRAFSTAFEKASTSAAAAPSGSRFAALKEGSRRGGRRGGRHTRKLQRRSKKTRRVRRSVH